MKSYKIVVRSHILCPEIFQTGITIKLVKKGQKKLQLGVFHKQNNQEKGKKCKFGLKNRLAMLPCCCCVTWYETWTVFVYYIFPLEVKFCGVIRLYLAKVWSGNCAVPLFVTFLNTRIWQGRIQSSSYPGHHQTSARPGRPIAKICLGGYTNYQPHPQSLYRAGIISCSGQKI